MASPFDKFPLVEVPVPRRKLVNSHKKFKKLDEREVRQTLLQKNFIQKLQTHVNHITVMREIRRRRWRRRRMQEPLDELGGGPPALDMNLEVNENALPDDQPDGQADQDDDDDDKPPRLSLEVPANGQGADAPEADAPDADAPEADAAEADAPEADAPAIPNPPSAAPSTSSAPVAAPLAVAGRAPYFPRPIRKGAPATKHQVETYLKTVPFKSNGFPHHVSRLHMRNLHLEITAQVNTGLQGRGKFDADANKKCVFCRCAATDEEPLVQCHGMISGQTINRGRIVMADRPHHACRSMFHMKCIENYSMGAFFFQYSTRLECQAAFLCPLHCCDTCNQNHHRQSAYISDLIECVICLRAFHVDTCFPAGGTFVDVSLELDGKVCQFEMAICSAHIAPPQLNGPIVNRLDSPVVPIKKHITECSSTTCSEKKGFGELVECIRCVRSFHAMCRDMVTHDGQPVPADVCDFCLSYNDFPLHIPVLALWKGGRFYLGTTHDMAHFPVTQRRGSKWFQRAGHVVVEWWDKPDLKKKFLSLLPIHQVVPLIENYIPMGKTLPEREYWQRIFTHHDENYLSSLPPVLKKVYSETKISKYYHNVKKQKLESRDAYVCDCKGDNRCTTDSCMYFVDGMECPPECEKIGGGCNNRKISTGFVHPNMELREAKGKGYGVFATKDIAKDDFLTEYVGEIIDRHEKAIRQSTLVVSGDHQPNLYTLQMGSHAIDAAAYGNISRYINHCCDPNATAPIRLIFVKKSKDKFFFEQRACLVADRDIKKDEEITFAYQMDKLDTLPICKCGAKNCDEFMTMKKPGDKKKVDGDGNQKKKKKKASGKKKGQTPSYMKPTASSFLKGATGSRKATVSNKKFAFIKTTSATANTRTSSGVSAREARRNARSDDIGSKRKGSDVSGPSEPQQKVQRPSTSSSTMSSRPRRTTRNSGAFSPSTYPVVVRSESRDSSPGIPMSPGLDDLDYQMSPPRYSPMSPLLRSRRSGASSSSRDQYELRDLPLDYAHGEGTSSQAAAPSMYDDDHFVAPQLSTFLSPMMQKLSTTDIARRGGSPRSRQSATRGARIPRHMRPIETGRRASLGIIQAMRSHNNSSSSSSPRLPLRLEQVVQDEHRPEEEEEPIAEPMETEDIVPGAAPEAPEAQQVAGRRTGRDRKPKKMFDIEK